MVFTAKILSWRFHHLNIVGCLLKTRPIKGGSRAPQDPPLATPLGLRHVFAIVSSQISTMIEPVNAILKHEPANRRLEISPRDISFLSSLSIIHGAP